MNQYPYNANVGMNVVPGPVVLNGPNTCCKNMLLVMSIIIFIFLIIEISVLNSLGIYTENAFVIVDEVGILVVALLFLISFSFSRRGIQGINPIVRTIVTIVVWIFGFALRGMGNMMVEDSNNIGIFFMFLGIRAFLLFFAIPVTFVNGSTGKNNIK